MGIELTASYVAVLVFGNKQYFHPTAQGCTFFSNFGNNVFPWPPLLTYLPLSRGVRYIDKPYRLSIYRYVLKISISIRSLLKISISISIKTFIEISISIRTFLKISISISIRSF